MDGAGIFAKIMMIMMLVVDGPLVHLMISVNRVLGHAKSVYTAKPLPTVKDVLSFSELSLYT